MYLLAKDAISGKEGTVTATIAGKVSTLAEVVSLKATIDKTKNEFRALGHRGAQHKATGWTGKGSVTFYYVTSEWTRLMIDYARTGRDLYFDIHLANHDPGSDIGRQRITLRQCNLDNIDVAMIDVNADWLTSSFSFTFSDIDMQEAFAKLPG